MSRKKKSKRSAWGSVVYRKDRKKWAVRVPVDGKRTASGRPLYRVHLFETKAEAVNKLKELRGLHDAGLLVIRKKNAPADEACPDVPFTLLAAIDEYIGMKKGEGAAKKTLQSYRGIRNVMCSSNSPLRTVAVSALDTEMIEHYRAWRREHVFKIHCPPGGKPEMLLRPGVTASNATVNRDITLIKSALNRLVSLKRLEENPAAGLGRGSEKERVRVALSDEEARQLVSAADDRLRPIILTALYTGARKSEVLSLTWGDVDLDEGRVTICRTKTYNNANRLPIAPDLVTELRALLGSRIPRPADRVFGLLNIRAAWRRTVRDAGLEGKRGLVFHSLRHTFATKFLSEGGNVNDLKEILGHSTLNTTLKYLHMVDSRVRATMTGLSYGSVPRGEVHEDLRTRDAYPSGRTGTDEG